MLLERTVQQGWTPGCTGTEGPDVPAGGTFTAAVSLSGVGLLSLD